MTDSSWDEGMALLEANCRDYPMTDRMKALRASTLRAALGHLTDEQWGFVVQQAIRKPDGKYPVLGELEEYAKSAPVREGLSDATLAQLPPEARQRYLEQRSPNVTDRRALDRAEASVALERIQGFRTTGGD